MTRVEISTTSSDVSRRLTKNTSMKTRTCLFDDGRSWWVLPLDDTHHPCSGHTVTCLITWTGTFQSQNP